MKRKFVLAALFAATLMMGFVSCKDDEEDPKPEPEPTPVVEKEFTVKFDANGGTGSAADAKVKEGQEATLPATGITREGYTFKGWSESKDGAVVTSFKPTADATLYAVWEKNEEQPPASDNHCIVIKTVDMEAYAWDTQFWFKSTIPFKEGDSWEVSMRVKSEIKVDATYPGEGWQGSDLVVSGIPSQTHKGTPGGYIHYAAVGDVPFDTEWQTYTQKGTFSKEQQDGDWVAFNMNQYKPANTYYFDDISFKVNGTEVIVNGDCEGTDFSSFAYKLWSEGDYKLDASGNKELDGDGKVQKTSPIHTGEAVVEVVK